MPNPGRTRGDTLRMIVWILAALALWWFVSIACFDLESGGGASDDGRPRYREVRSGPME